VIVSLAFGIRATISMAGLCYLALIPAALRLIALGRAEKGAAAEAGPAALRPHALSARRSGR